MLADARRGDWILCQITSKSYADSDAIGIAASDFSSGSLVAMSYARPGKLFTASTGIIRKDLGKLAHSKTNEILSGVRAFFA